MNFIKKENLSKCKIQKVNKDFNILIKMNLGFQRWLSRFIIITDDQQNIKILVED